MGFSKFSRYKRNTSIIAKPHCLAWNPNMWQRGSSSRTLLLHSLLGIRDLYQKTCRSTSRPGLGTEAQQIPLDPNIPLLLSPMSLLRKLHSNEMQMPHQSQNDQKSKLHPYIFCPLSNTYPSFLVYPSIRSKP